MDTKKKYNKSEAEIMALVDPHVSRAVAWVDTRLTSEQSRIQRYYDGDLPRRQHEGSSSYVSSDVYDGVESMKSQLLEVFAGGHDIVRFKALNDQDVEAARIETAYVQDQIFSVCKNNGQERFNDVIDDSLKNRNGVTQIYWEQCVERDEHTFEGMSLEDVQALAAQEDVEIDASLDGPDNDGDPDDLMSQATYSGKLTRIIDKSGLRFENVPPEEYFTDGKKKYREESVRGRKVLKTKADLIYDGYDREKVMSLWTTSLCCRARSRNARRRPTTAS